jgi:predicted aldo/keto reductase-like oxidoreductase
LLSGAAAVLNCRHGKRRQGPHILGKGRLMKHETSRRGFLRAGLVVPAAGLVSSDFEASAQAPAGVSYRILGKTGLKVSTVGFGTGFNPNPEVVARAIDLGVNFFDTSRDYGDSERLVGGAIKGKRDKILISTKTNGKTKDDIFKQMDVSLQTLGTDRVDVYHLHAKDSPGTVTDEMIEALEALKQQGKTRSIGLSTHDPHNVLELILKTGKFDVVQLTYSYPIGGVFREEAIEKLNAAGIGLVAMKVVRAMSGIRMMEAFAQGKNMMNMGIDMSVKKTGEASVSAIKWVLRNPAIATTVPDPANAANLEMNVRAMTEPYTAKDERLLFALNEQIRPLYCRMCYECRGLCPNGLPVTDMLRFLAYNDFGGNFHQARAKFSELPGEVRKVRCSDCSSCAIQCPNGVAVRDRLIRAQELLA